MEKEPRDSMFLRLRRLVGARSVYLAFGQDGAVIWKFCAESEHHRTFPVQAYSNTFISVLDGNIKYIEGSKIVQILSDHTQCQESWLSITLRT